MSDLTTWAKACLVEYKTNKKPFTKYFNGCKIDINQGSTLKSIKDFYYHNVDLTQFEGWK